MSAGWFVINGDMLLAALRRCSEGEDPDVMYIELFSNSKREDL